MAATITNSKVYLTADGLGWQAVRAPLPAAPVGTTGLLFVYRAYFDSFSGGTTDNLTTGWNHTWAFGLTFGSTMPSYNSRANFFGVANLTDTNLNLRQYTPTSNYYGTNQPATTYLTQGNQWSRFYPGSTSSFADNTDTGTYWGAQTPTYFPSNPTTGQQYTGIWIIKKSEISDRIMVSAGYNMESLDRTNLMAALSSTNTVWTNSDQEMIETTNWRVGGNMNFPSYFIAKMPSPTIGKQFIIDKIDLRYYNTDSFV